MRSLTATQIQVLRLLAVDDLTSAQAAERLGLSKHTVRTHRQTILMRLGAHSLAHAVYITCKQGII